jgi:adenylate cyclase
LRAITRQRWAVVLRSVAIAGLIGVAIAERNGAATASDYAIPAVDWMLIAFCIASLEAFVASGTAGEALRRWPIAAAFLVRTIAYAAIILVVATAVPAMLFARADATPALVPTLALGLAASALFNFAFTIRSIVGAATFAALLTGRYHRPREEERVVLMLDIIDSTSIAERLGPRRFLGLLDRFVGLATEPILDAAGEIYRYVGDEIIVTWPLARGVAEGRAVRTAFAVEGAILARRAMWEREFGVVPRCRAALHAGPLVVGEIGAVKREIMLLGDTMNTASRIEDACRELDRPCLASAALIERTILPPGIAAERLAPMALRGKSGEVVLYALRRR